MAEAAAISRVTVVPANEASWEDLQAVLGTRGYPLGLLVPALQDAGQGVGLRVGSSRGTRRPAS